MSPKALLERVRQRPFKPFRLIVTEGASYEVRHPELLVVGHREVFIGLPALQTDELFDTSVLVDLLHVVRLEPLPVPGSAQGAAAS